jgi:hypothetical protein
METVLIKIVQKPTDYKVCNQCKQINWYENECCKNMECAVHNDYDETADAVQDWIKDEYGFYMEEEFMSEEEVDNILVDI